MHAAAPAEAVTHLDEVFARHDLDGAAD